MSSHVLFCLETEKEKYWTHILITISFQILFLGCWYSIHVGSSKSPLSVYGCEFECYLLFYQNQVSLAVCAVMW